MPADLRSEFSLPGDPSKVFGMLTNPEFLAAKVALAQSGNYSISGTSPDLTIQVQRTVAADLPPMVRKFVGENLVVKETQTWSKSGDDLYVAQFSLAIPGAPVEITGQIKLSGQVQTQVEITGKVKVNVPIFGAAAEPQVVAQINKVLADEQALCQDWINK
jgi:hypothetical protein